VSSMDELREMTGELLIHCLAGKSRSTTAHGMILMLMDPEKSLADTAKEVMAGRLQGKGWNPVVVAKEWFKEKEFKRAGTKMTFVFGESEQQQASYLRLKKRQGLMNAGDMSQEG